MKTGLGLCVAHQLLVGICESLLGLKDTWEPVPAGKEVYLVVLCSRPLIQHREHVMRRLRHLHSPLCFKVMAVIIADL
jgi:hypothetical protein